MARSSPSVGILIVAYNAVGTLAAVLDRIPKSFRSSIAEVIVSDDASQDATYLVGLGYRSTVDDLPLTVVRNERNLGYGGNQKVGYRLAIDHGLDIVVLLHGDGQYAPELLPDMVAPLERGACDAVLGSRMLVPGAARKGGMPLYKYAGNRILTTLENAMLGSNLSEFHSGYRAYSTETLRGVDFESFSDGFDFDTQMIIAMHDQRMRILEIPIPTYYGDEICYVNGLQYARDVLADVVRWRMGMVAPGPAPRGLCTGSHHESAKEHTLKGSPCSSHGRILSWLAGRSPRSVLDLGCSSGLLAAELTAMGHHVTGVDVAHFPEVASRMAHFVQADLDGGIPDAVGGSFDVVLASDVLEHVRHPEIVLRQMGELLAPGGLALVSIPNFAHWYARARVVSGRFDYDDQGILDRTHLRFFTRRSFDSLVRSAGLRIDRTEAIGVPIERLTDSGAAVVRWASRLDQLAATVLPSLFAYQYLFEIRPVSPRVADHLAPSLGR